MVTSHLLTTDSPCNLTNFHLTVTCYKNLSLLRKSTREHPLFIGPMLIHGNSRQRDFREFFGHLNGMIHERDPTVTKPIIGTDDETAMRKAISHCFDCEMLYCTRHMKENTARALQRNATEATQRHITNLIFGTDGLTMTKNQVIFDARKTELNTYIQLHPPDFATYFDSHLLPKLQNNLDIALRHDDIQPNWTNNNAESVNHILKLQIDWRSRTVPQLVDLLEDKVRAQFTDLERAIIGQGNFELAPDFLCFRKSRGDWLNLKDDVRKRHLTKFLNTKQRLNNRTVTSSDSGLVVMRSGSDGGKPNQQKGKLLLQPGQPKKGNLKLLCIYLYCAV